MAASLPYAIGSQQTVNPFAAQAFQNAMQQAGVMNQQQFQSAMQQSALQSAAAQPNQGQPAETADPLETTAAYGQPKQSKQTFNMGSLNALAQTTPSANFTPTVIPGGAAAQGLTNMFNIGEQRKTQQAIMGLYQQQAAQQQAAQEAAAQQYQQGLASLSSMYTNSGFSPEQASALAFSTMNKLNPAGVSNNVFDPLMQQGLRGQTSATMAQQLGQVAPELANRGQQVVLSPIQQAQAGVITGAPAAAFNQYGAQNNLLENQQKQAQANIEITKAGFAPTVAQQGVTKTAGEIQGQSVDNALKQFELNNAPIKARIDQLKAQGEIDRAAREETNYQQGMELVRNMAANPEMMNNPAMVRGVNAQLAGMGFKYKIEAPTGPKSLQTGKDTRMIVDPNTGMLVTPDAYNQSLTVKEPTVQPSQPQRVNLPPQKAGAPVVKSTQKTSNLINLEGLSPAERAAKIAEVSNQTMSYGERDSMRRKLEIAEARAKRAEEDLKRQQSSDAARKAAAQKTKDIIAMKQALKGQPTKPQPIKLPPVTVGGLSLPRAF